MEALSWGRGMRGRDPRPVLVGGEGQGEEAGAPTGRIEPSCRKMGLVEGGGERRGTRSAAEVGILAVGMWGLLREAAVVEKGNPVLRGLGERLLR